MANRFSPVFTIDITTAVNAGQTATITGSGQTTGLGQAFELIGVQVVGSSGCVVTVKNAGAVAAVGFSNALINGSLGSSTTVTNANSTFASTSVITCEVTTANATRISLLCRAIDSVSRVVDVAVA
jgi:hypothetical protein